MIIFECIRRDCSCIIILGHFCGLRAPIQLQLQPPKSDSAAIENRHNNCESCLQNWQLNLSGLRMLQWKCYNLANNTRTIATSIVIAKADLQRWPVLVGQFGFARSQNFVVVVVVWYVWSLEAIVDGLMGPLSLLGEQSRIALASFLEDSSPAFKLRVEQG